MIASAALDTCFPYLVHFDIRPLRVLLAAVEAIMPLGSGLSVLVHYARDMRQGRFDLLDAWRERVASGPYQGPADFETGCSEQVVAVGPDANGVIAVVHFRLKR